MVLFHAKLYTKQKLIFPDLPTPQKLRRIKCIRIRRCLGFFSQERDFFSFKVTKDERLLVHIHL